MIKSFQEYYIECNENSRAAWLAIRRDLRNGIAKNDSNGLFNAVIKKMQWFLSETGSIDWIEGFYENEAGYKVNNSNSRFYIYG